MNISQWLYTVTIVWECNCKKQNKQFDLLKTKSCIANINIDKFLLNIRKIQFRFLTKMFIKNKFFKMNGFSTNILKQLKSCTLVALIILVLMNNSASGRTIKSKNYRDAMKPDVIVQCQSACIEKFFFQMDNLVTLENNQNDNNGAMCKDFCQILYAKDRHIFRSICTDHTCVSFIFFI